MQNTRLRSIKTQLHQLKLLFYKTLVIGLLQFAAAPLNHGEPFTDKWRESLRHNINFCLRRLKNHKHTQD